MSKQSKEGYVNIRVRIERELLERIDRLVGTRGRQKFIREAILWRLDQELPPPVLELVEEVEELRARVEHLESLQSPRLYLESLDKSLVSQICRDDLERRLLAYFLRHGGATTTELSAALLGSRDKRRTVLNRITGINARAVEVIGVPLLVLDRALVRGKRGAWWLVNEERLARGT